MVKRRILIFVEWFTPAYKAGGPVQSVANIIRLLYHEFDFLVVTSDRDLGDHEAFNSVPLNAWIETPTYSIIHLSPLFQSFHHIKGIIDDKKPHVVYCNSLFSFRFTMVPMFAARKANVKTILAPRGMLGEGALKFKRYKKSVFIYLSRLAGLFDNITWHATDQAEKDEIIKHYGAGVQVRIASNISVLPQGAPGEKNKIAGEVLLLHISAISHKKNFLFALDQLTHITESRVHFVVIGPIIHHRYWEDCKKHIKRLPANVTVEYLGSIPHIKLHDIISRCHFLLLPTWHENYCHVIIESLAHGCPVIISDKTPWRDLQEKGIGWDLSLENPGEWVKALDYCCAMRQDEYTKMSQQSYQFARGILTNPGLVHATRELFS